MTIETTLSIVASGVSILAGLATLATIWAGRRTPRVPRPASQGWRPAHPRTLVATVVCALGWAFPVAFLQGTLAQVGNLPWWIGVPLFFVSFTAFIGLPFLPVGSLPDFKGHSGWTAALTTPLYLFFSGFILSVILSSTFHSASDQIVDVLIIGPLLLEFIVCLAFGLIGPET